jgi:hypothetical protein
MLDSDLNLSASWNGSGSKTKKCTEMIYGTYMIGITIFGTATKFVK